MTPLFDPVLGCGWKKESVSLDGTRTCWVVRELATLPRPRSIALGTSLDLSEPQGSTSATPYLLRKF